MALFWWGGNLGSSPSLIHAIRMLAQDGYGVDVIMRSYRAGFSEPPRFPPGVRVVDCPPILPGLEYRERLLQRLPRPLRPLIALWPAFDRGKLLFELARFLLLSLRLTLPHRYAAAIGVDTCGLVMAWAIGLARRCPVLYWSLELRFLSDFGDPIRRLLKRMERRCSRRAALTIIQDELRAETLAGENGVPRERIRIVPNGPLGEPVLRRGRFFHEKLSLPPGERVVLCAGGIEPGNRSLELARAAAAWPEGWTLVLHDCQRRSRAEAFIRQVEEAGRGRVALSLEPVPYDELDEVMASADVGVAFYQAERGPNFERIVGASGKLAHYLRCGVPVVCEALPGFPEMLRHFGCGIAVRTPADIAPALARIGEGYAGYRRGAVACYLARYEFGNHFRRVLDELRGTAAASTPLGEGAAVPAAREDPVSTR